MQHGNEVTGAKANGGQPCAADGAWDRLNDLEFRAAPIIAKQLSEFEPVFRDTYEAGVIVPVLRSKGKATLDVRCAALSWKRVLNDLRGVWVLLQRGYTSQAAAVAASLYEGSLATICLTQSEDNIAEFCKNAQGQIPWSPMDMAKMVIRGKGNGPHGKEFENGWRALYAHYVWLCQIKHCGPDSIIHDTVASTIAEKTYVVMALPNIRDEDVPVKATIAIISLQRALECIKAFAAALGFEDKLPNDFEFAARFERARASIRKAFGRRRTTPNPINISRSWFVKKYPSVS